MGRRTSTAYTQLSLDDVRARLGSHLGMRSLDPASDVEGHYENDEFRVRSKNGGPFRFTLCGEVRDLGDRRAIETEWRAPFGLNVASGLGFAGLLASAIFLPPPWDDYAFYIFAALIVAPGVLSALANKRLAKRQRELMQLLEADQ